MKRLLLILITLSLLLTGCIGKSKATNTKEKNDESEPIKNEQITEEVLYVKAAYPKVMDFENRISLPGKIEPRDTVIITSKINGTVEDIFVDIGSTVKNQAMLCKIDDTTYQLQYNKASTAVKSSEIALSQLKDFEKYDNLEPQQIQGARTQYNTTKLEFNNMEKTYNRYKKLYENNTVSKAEFEEIEKSYNLLKERLESAHQSLKHAERTWKYNVSSAEVGLEAARNDFELAKENLEYTNITSPIDGVVSEKNIAIGENISPGTRLFTVVNIDNLYIETGISEKDINNIKEGQEAYIRVDALNDKLIQGSIETISPVLNRDSKTYPVKIMVENKDDILKAGMFSTIEIVVDSHKSSLAVPKSSVYKDGGEDFVYIVKDGKAVKNKIKLGFSKDNYFEIVEGLNKKDQVITSVNDKIKDGSVVKIK